MPKPNLADHEHRARLVRHSDPATETDVTAHRALGRTCDRPAEGASPPDLTQPGDAASGRAACDGDTSADRGAAAPVEARRVPVERGPDGSRAPTSAVVASDVCPVGGSGEGHREPEVDTWLPVGNSAMVRSLVGTSDLMATALRTGPAATAPEVERMLGVVVRPMSISEAVALSGGGAESFGAVVRLVADGRLRIRDGWSISPEKTVEPVSGTTGAGDLNPPGWRALPPHRHASPPVFGRIPSRERESAEDAGREAPLAGCSTTEELLQRAASHYCSPQRPTLSSCHRRLSAEVREENAWRLGRGLPPLELPSYGRVRLAVRRLHSSRVHAARHGRATTRARFTTFGGRP